MRIVFFGSGPFGEECLRWLSASGHELLEVVTQPARPTGRGRKVASTPIGQLAEDLGLVVRESDNVNDPAFVARLGSLRPQVLLVIAFGQKLGPALLGRPEFRTVNLHGSLLPKYRGAAPVNWAIIRGEKETGLTLIEMDEGWDTGAILGQVKTAIGPGETAGELYDRLAAMGPKLLAEVLEQIAQRKDRPRPQDEALASRAPKLNKSDGAIRWSLPARTICNHIHGMWPWPGAFCYLRQQGRNRQERLSLARAAVLPSPEPSGGQEAENLPGSLAEDMSVVCGQGRLQLLEVKPEAGKRMPFADFVNGRHLQKQDRFLDGG